MNWIDITTNELPKPGTVVLVTLEPKNAYTTCYSSMVKKGKVDKYQNVLLDGADTKQQLFYSERFYISAYITYPQPYQSTANPE